MTATLLERFDAKHQFYAPTGCWLWTGGAFKDGYGAIGTHGKMGKAHRVAYRLFVGSIPEGLCVLHKCDTPLCVCPDHLFLGTIQDNTTDMLAKGRESRGENRHNSKLTEGQVLEIVGLRGTMEQKEIGNLYGVTKATVSDIQLGKRWAWLTGIKEKGQ